MFPAPFTYHRARSVAEALQLLRRFPDAKLLAGGHSLLPLMKLRLARPRHLIDIGRIGALRGISVTSQAIVIRPLTTHAEVASSRELRRACPLLPEAAALIGDPAVRNRGTVGGNVVHADPGSDLPAVFSALGATVVIKGLRGQRTVPASEFFTGFLQTVVGPRELVTAIRVPRARGKQVMGYAKLPHPASRYALVSAAAVLTVRAGRCQAASVTVGGLVPSPRHLTSVEQALQESPLTPQAIAAAAARAEADLHDDILGDIHASAGYRRAMAAVYVRRALTLCAQRAGVS